MNNENAFRSFLIFAAVCSIFGAVTTALLLFLPNPPATEPGGEVLLYKNTLYRLKLWILFLHPQFNLLASLGVAVLLFRKYPLWIIPGLLFLMVWAYTEMTQQALLIDALNQIWRPAYDAAADELARQTYSTLITGAEGLSDSKYFLVLYGFGLGSLFYGMALKKEPGLGRGLGWSLIFIGILSLASFARYYLGLSFFLQPVNKVYTYIYPVLQPLVRIGLGIWMWRSIHQSPLQTKS